LLSQHLVADYVIVMLFVMLTAQLAELRNVRYSKLLCENADFLPYIQTNAFLHPLSDVQNQLR